MWLCLNVLSAPCPLFQENLFSHKVINHHNPGDYYLGKHVVEPELLHSSPHQCFRQHKACDTQYYKHNKFFRLIAVFFRSKYKAYAQQVVYHYRHTEGNSAGKQIVQAPKLSEQDHQAAIDPKAHNTHYTKPRDLAYQLIHDFPLSVWCIAPGCAPVPSRSPVGSSGWWFPKSALKKTIGSQRWR